MTLRLALIFAATALAPASGSAQEQAVPPEAKTAVESCAARKFETIVVRIVDGKKRGSKVRLCGKEGQTDAEWASTLKDAAKKVEANATMPQAAKDQLIAALNAEISKVDAKKAAAITLPPSVRPPVEKLPEYSTLPPLPTAPAAATKSSLAKPAPLPKKPRLTLHCYTPGELGAGGPCLTLERETMVTVRADEAMAGGARLRFLRRGDARGEVALAQMRKGQSLRFRLPSPLCAGVGASKVEIQIVGGSASQVLDTLGPYPLRC